MRRILLTAGFLLVFTHSAYAQGVGSIFGKVTDSSGAVMPGVTVTVAGTGLQQPRDAVTTETGAYQFPNIPIGTYSVTFELQGFKKATRPNIVIVAGFNAGIDQNLEIGQMTEEMTVSGAPPVVDTKRTTTGATFDAMILQNIPTARDPWQVINMTPGVIAGLNVGGSSSGQQVGLASRGTTANVQWNVEGGSTTDLSSNSSASYYNFDSLEQIQVINGGGDVSIQSSGLSINLITKSGSNIFKGSAVGTFENDAMQSTNVTEELFRTGTGGFLSGNPLTKITNVSFEYGGPIIKNKLWFWMNADHQDINVGILNFFDRDKGGDCVAYAEAQRLGTLSGQIAFNDLQKVQDCLKNDKTTIYHLGGKVNFQLNSAHKFQYLLQGDNKSRNARGASATTAIEAATRQYSDPWKGFPQPTHSLTHTYVASDKLVFNNIYTFVRGGFFLDYQDYDTCGDSRYNGSDSNADYTRDPSCLWNQQQLSLRTTGYRSRSILASYQTTRPSHELKTDGTYFLSGKLGGDHSLKFGVGYRKNPIQSFSHYSGGARATLQCNGNLVANCSDARITPGTAGAGLVPYQAVLYRDQLRNNDWWMWSGYLQDSFSRGKFRVQGGLRYDWQQSKYLGGCVPANVIRPDLLPAQCEEATQQGTDPNTGELETIKPFGNFAPRVSLTYDLFGNGKTALKAAGAYYYQTRITLADSLGGLFTVTSLTYGNNTSAGACTGTSCWTDANRDGVVQGNELTGTPTSSSSRFNTTTGVLAPAGNAVDESTKIGRTREAVVGIQHELIPNLAVGVDYIFRKYDRGTATYTVGFQPGAPGFPLQNIYDGPLSYTDPISGNTGEYYVVRQGAMRPSGLGSITMTNPNYQIYNGVDITVTKRFSNKWQFNGSVTIQDNPNYYPEGNTSFINPTARTYAEGVSTLAKYVLKANGSYQLPWGVMASGNFNMYQGGTRTLTINGPGNVYGGVNAAGAATTINYATLQFQPLDGFRYEDTKLLDLGLQKTIGLPGSERYRIKMMFDAFNVLNTNETQTYGGANVSLPSALAPNSIIPPRVFRIGAMFSF
ncbi:MAG: carboxypeptidase regulatory-like domain-containing protein [Acidobacteriota bacterium]|nr:carboxypeptidase regulatory-like domain-containing protein [Acidobacteriota bacterium]